MLAIPIYEWLPVLYKINYIVIHNLYDVIVEYVVYDKPVGFNNDKVLITELRSDY